MTLKFCLILSILKLISSFQLENGFENEKPIIQDLFISSKIIENKKLFLTCQLATGKTPMFEWLFNNQKIQPDDNLFINNLEEMSVLNIRSMKIDLAGEYLCKASNSYGSDSKKINLTLNSKYFREVLLKNLTE